MGKNHQRIVMKKLFLALVILAPAILIAQAPPILRNSFTTNAEPAARNIVTQIVNSALSPYVTNFVSLTNLNTFQFALGTDGKRLNIANGALTTNMALFGANVPSAQLLSVDGTLRLTTIPSKLLRTEGIGNVTNAFIGEGVEFDEVTLSIAKTITSVLAGTNNAVNTNLFLNVTNKLTTIDVTNNMTSTNFSGVAAGEFHNAVFVYSPQLISRTNVYPVGNQYGQGWKTNVNAPLFTTLTNGVTYVLSLTTVGTNVFASMSAWQQ